MLHLMVSKVFVHKTKSQSSRHEKGMCYCLQYNSYCILHWWRI